MLIYVCDQHESMVRLLKEKNNLKGLVQKVNLQSALSAIKTLMEMSVFAAAEDSYFYSDQSD